MKGSKGTLSIVATPIGNLGDLSPRAVEALAASDRIVAEDTRRSRALLSHAGIAGKVLESFHAHSSEGDVARLANLLGAGEHIALVTDAGTPAVSDPGAALVRAAIDAGARVVPVPGPSAVLAALVASGMATDAGFTFLGFLPREGHARRERIERACATPEPVVFFEAPGRTHGTLAELAEATPDRAACVARELTKLHEEFVRGTLRELAEGAREWVGEIAIVLGAYNPALREENVDDAALVARIDHELAAGTHVKAIAERLAAWSGRPRRKIYEMVVERKGERR